MLLHQLFASSTGRLCLLALSLLLELPTARAQTNAAPAAAPEILAHTPEGLQVSVTDVLAELQRAPEAARQSVLSRPESIYQITNNLMWRRMLAREAERQGAAGQDTLLMASLQLARDRVLSESRLSQLDALNAPNEAAIEAYARNVYQANAAKYEKPAQTRARHILLAKGSSDSLKTAQDLLAQLRAGASFEELAKTKSIDAGSAAKGGDLGFFAAGKMVKPFEDAVNALAKPGDLSEPVESEFGYHIIRLEERRDKGLQPYDELRKQLMDEARVAILNDLRQQKVQSLNQDIVFDKNAIEAMARTATK